MDYLYLSDVMPSSHSLLGNISLGENHFGKLSFVLNYNSGNNLEGYFKIDNKSKILGMYITTEDKIVYLETTTQPHFGTINNEAVSHKMEKKVGYLSQYDTGVHLISNKYDDNYYWLENFLIDDNEVDYNIQSVIVYYRHAGSGGDVYRFDSVSFFENYIFLNLTRTKIGYTEDMSGWVFSCVINKDYISDISNILAYCLMY
jgi:hypothetical protein